MTRHFVHRADAVQKELDDFARQIGLGIVDLSQTGIPGIPDRIYLDRGRAFWCEVKSSKSAKLRKSQQAFREYLRKYGIPYYRIETPEDLLRLKEG